jgi:hypothetical protein
MLKPQEQRPSSEPEFKPDTQRPDTGSYGGGYTSADDADLAF